jgi:hypothetical protein
MYMYSGEHGISHTLDSYYLNFIKIRYWRHFHNSLGETSVMITYVMIDYNDRNWCAKFRAPNCTYWMLNIYCETVYENF